MRILQIVNPNAGRRSRADVAGAVAEAFAAAGWQVTVRITDGPGGATDLARQGAAEGYDAVFALGGDGTLSEIVRGLLDTGVPAGIVPTGTGNDFARTIGLPMDPVAAVARYVAGAPAEIDLLEIDDGRNWAVNIVGAGFDARVARRVNLRSRLTGGLLAYLTCVGVELARNRPTNLSLTVDGERWEGRALLVAIANARSYGAGMIIAPQAEIADGMLDVVLVEHMSRARFVADFPKVMRGAHLQMPAVRAWRATEVSIDADQPAPVLIDGDVDSETPLSVRIAPRAATLWMPGQER